jgi:hypothetical protein
VAVSCVCVCVFEQAERIFVKPTSLRETGFHRHYFFPIRHQLLIVVHKAQTTWCSDLLEGGPTPSLNLHCRFFLTNRLSICRPACHLLAVPSMEVDVGQAGGAVEEADVNFRVAEQAGGDSLHISKHAFLPATCLPEAHQPVGTCGRSEHATFATGAMCAGTSQSLQLARIVRGVERVRAYVAGVGDVDAASVNSDASVLRYSIQHGQGASVRSRTLALPLPLVCCGGARSYQLCSVTAWLRRGKTHPNMLCCPLTRTPCLSSPPPRDSRIRGCRGGGLFLRYLDGGRVGASAWVGATSDSVLVICPAFKRKKAPLPGTLPPQMRESAGERGVLIFECARVRREISTRDREADGPRARAADATECKPDYAYHLPLAY